MVMQNFGGDKKVIMVFSKVANWIRLNYDVWKR